MRHHVRQWILQPLLAFSALAFPHFGNAQANPGAIRQNSINVYAAGAAGQTDYGQAGTGFLVGGDFTTHTRFFDPSLDVRFNLTVNPVLHEKVFLGGIKLERPYHRFHPYVHLQIGYGVITFDHPSVNNDGSLYSYDDSTVYSFGGGLDYNLTYSFAVKVDAQYQFWNLGEGAASQRLNPDTIAVGLVYRIPYRRLRPRKY